MLAVRSNPGPRPPQGEEDRSGYLLVGRDGRAYGCGLAAGLSRHERRVGDTTVAAAALTPTGLGTWVATADGRLLVEGDAPNWGRRPADENVEFPIVDMVVAADGMGSWWLASNGGVTVFGAAPYHGVWDFAGEGMTAAALAVTPSGGGYWTASEEGAIKAFGDAPEVPDVAFADDALVALAPTRTGQGLWALSGGGLVVALGDAPDAGSPADLPVRAPAVALAGWRDADGYWVAEVDGAVRAFGDAPYLGRAPADALVGPVAALAVLRAT